jgi:hypothetical protein
LFVAFFCFSPAAAVVVTDKLSSDIRLLAELPCSYSTPPARKKKKTMATNGAPPVFILYKVINAAADADDPCFNAFVLPYGVKPTLASIKQYV